MVTLKDFQVAARIVNSKGLVDCLQSSGSRQHPVVVVVFYLSDVQSKVVGVCSKLHNGHLYGIQWLVGGEGGGSP